MKTKLLILLNTIGLIIFLPLCYFVFTEIAAYTQILQGSLGNELKKSQMLIFVPQISITLGILLNGLLSIWSELFKKKVNIIRYLSVSYSLSIITIWCLVLALLTL